MKYTAIDIETTGLRWDSRLLLVGYSVWEDDQEIERGSLNIGMVDIFHDRVSTVSARKSLAAAILGSDWLIFHNGSFDIPFLIKHQILSIGDLQGRVFDTLVMARCTAGHDSVSLRNLVSEYGIAEVINDPAWAVKSKRKVLESVGVENASAYVEMDCYATARVFQIIYPMAQEFYGDKRIAEEGDFVLEVSKMRLRGTRLNVPKIRDMITKAKAREMEILQELAAYKIRSGNDNHRILAFLAGENAAHLLPTTEKGNPQLDEASLSSILGNSERVDRVVGFVLEARDLHKMRSTWLEGFLNQMDTEERIHPLLSAGGTVSFRLSCTEPNAQAVRRDLKIFTCTPGYVLVEFDYSQAELRAGAAYARENTLAEVFHKKEDVHLSTSRMMFGEEHAKAKRSLAKTANFSAFYGGGAPALDRALGCGMDVAQHVVNLHRETFPGIRTASKRATQRWEQRGYVVAAHGKRIYASPTELKERIYKAYNALIQSSIAEIIRVATMDIAKSLPQVNIVLQVHDSLYIELPNDDKLHDLIWTITDIMQRSGPQQVLQGTTPPIDMVVDHNIVGEGAPFLEHKETVLV